MPLTISLDPESDGFLVEFPPLPGNHHTHHAKLPATLGGLIVLKRILRKRAEAEDRCSIGTPGAPTSHQIETIITALDSSRSHVTDAASDWLRAKRAEEREAARQKPKGPSNKIRRGGRLSLDDLELEF